MMIHRITQNTEKGIPITIGVALFPSEKNGKINSKNGIPREMQYNVVNLLLLK
jgi:hypothetical protein